MDWTTIITTIATCLITTLGASGIIALVMKDGNVLNPGEYELNPSI